MNNVSRGSRALMNAPTQNHINAAILIENNEFEISRLKLNAIITAFLINRDRALVPTTAIE
jgi:hypothetical protein